MTRGTTPTIEVTLEKVDVTEARIFLTLQDDNGKQMTFDSATDDFTVTFEDPDTVIELSLSQEQTFSLAPGRHSSQIRFIFPDGQTGATLIYPVNVDNVLLNQVISYE